MQLTPEERDAGQHNFQEAIGVTRRDFLKTGIAAGAVSGAGLGAMYFGYEASVPPLTQVSAERVTRVCGTLLEERAA